MAVTRISERDYTSNNSFSGVYDIAYIPGFGDITVDNDPGNKPVLCRSISELKTNFGTLPQTFALNMASDNTISFDYGSATKSIVFSGADPAYVMAHQLIQSGMPVYYERVNKFSAMNETLSFTSASWTKIGTTSNYSCTYAPSATTFAKVDSLSDIAVGSAAFSGIISYSIASDKSAVVFTANSSDITSLKIKARTNPDNITAKAMYDALLPSTSGATSILDKLKDKGTYFIKYLTTGGYPNFEYKVGSGASAEYLANKMLGIAGSNDSSDDADTGRGDCIAIIDHTNIPERPLTGTDSVDSIIQTSNKFSGMDSYGVMFTPWSAYPISNIGSMTEMELPASFGYLKAVAEYTKYGKKNWLAIANVARGKVTLNSQLTNDPVTVSVANYYQKDAETGTGRSMNAITYINPYGYCIWGNRTLMYATNGAKATGFLNIRSVLCDIKKVVYEASQENMFEPNSDNLWLNFSTKVGNILSSAQNASAIAGYSITKDTERSTKTKFYAIINIVPLYGVETFDITISITDSDVSVSES